MWGEEEIGDVYGVLQMALLEFLDRSNKLTKNFEDKDKGENERGGNQAWEKKGKHLTSK